MAPGPGCGGRVVGLSGTGPGSAGSGRGPRSTRLRTPPSSAIACSAMSGGNGLPCQPSLFSTSENPLPLMVLARITVGWLPDVSVRGGHRLVDGGQVMPVDGQHPGAECLHPALVVLKVPADIGLAALAEPVDVGHHDHVGQVVIGGLVEGLPDGTLGEFAVSAQHPDPVGEPLQVLACQRDPHAIWQPLAQRAGGDVNPRQYRGGMALQPLAEAPVAVQQFVFGDDPAALNTEYSSGDAWPLEKIKWSLTGRCG